MNAKPYTLLMLLEDPLMRDFFCDGLVDHPYNVILASSLEEAQSIVQTRDISCILVTDKLALSYDQASDSTFQGISPTIPTLIILTKGYQELLLTFDKYYRPTSAPYEYLPLPVGIEEITGLFGRMLATRASQS